MAEKKVIPKELTDRNQWALSNNKAPYQTNGERASSTDISTWTSYEDVINKSNHVGYFISEHDPYTVIDLDDCIINGVINDEAKRIVDSLNSFTEISQSGNGLHIFVKAKKPGNRSKNAEKGFEMYDKERFMVMTGNHLEGTPLEINEAQEMINYLYDMYFSKEEKKKQKSKVDTWQQSPNLEDEEILKIASNAKNGDKFKALFRGDISAYGSHSEADQALCNLLAFYTQDFEQIDRIFTSSGLYREKWDRDDYKTSTIENAINGLTNTFKPNGNAPSHIKVNGTVLPDPYVVKGGSLYMKVTKKVEGMDVETLKFISRKTPILTKEFHNVERPQVLYELQWNEPNRTIVEIIPASTIAIRKELLQLSEMGFSVNENNVKELINYLDLYLSYNDISRHYAVERLGNVKDKFIHPLLTNDVEIIAIDQGEKQIYEGFEVKGTSETWKNEVFNLIKDSPKAVFMVLASFASVLLHDLRIQPFIVDLSGTTSQGKTTTLRVAASVWGNESLMSEWNATRVSIERKAAYLNSFPLLLDDTRKADERVLKDIIYQFSGGRSKGRGTIKGSQREYTWNNILLSTGEVTINEYAKSQGGAAARIIPLVDQPLKNNSDNIIHLYEGLENNYGAIGIDFLKVWMTYKKELIHEYARFRSFYLNKSKGNEVLSRLAGYYSAVHFAGSILKNKLGLDVNLQAISNLFDEIAEENKAIDKPMQFLEEILTDLDSNRNDIFYEYEPSNTKTKAIYKKKQKQLYLTPAFTADFLGIEEKQTRNEWLKRGITIPVEVNGKERDYTLISHKGKKLRAIALNMNIVEELGFDFHEISGSFEE